MKMNIPAFNTPIMEKVKYLEAKSRVDDKRIAELEKQLSMRGTLADPNYDYDKKEYRKGEVEDE
jgi:hypothetical protein